jgi:hypothetical protein
MSAHWVICSLFPARCLTGNQTPCLSSFGLAKILFEEGLIKEGCGGLGVQMLLDRQRGFGPGNCWDGSHVEGIGAAALRNCMDATDNSCVAATAGPWTSLCRQMVVAVPTSG